MADKFPRITINPKGYKIEPAQNVPITQALPIIFDAILRMMLAVTDQFDEPKVRAKVKGDLYDMLNELASKTLTVFAPEIEQHPDLTTEAILKAEDEILMSKMSK